MVVIIFEWRNLDDLEKLGKRWSWSNLVKREAYGRTKSKEEPCWSDIQALRNGELYLWDSKNFVEIDRVKNLFTKLLGEIRYISWEKERKEKWIKSLLRLKLKKNDKVYIFDNFLKEQKHLILPRFLK